MAYPANIPPAKNNLASTKFGGAYTRVDTGLARDLGRPMGFCIDPQHSFSTFDRCCSGHTPPFETRGSDWS